MIKNLYKKDNVGRIQQWAIKTTGNSFTTMEGFVGGKITETMPTICEAKNEGRANATTPEQQAIKEALAKITRKKKDGWFDKIEDVDKTEHLPILPMLAKKWNDSQKHLNTLTHLCLQPKLDGIRCIATRQGLFSRKGERIIAVPHIERMINDMFATGLFDWVEAFDGELYNHDFKDNFNEIASVVRKTKPTLRDMIKSEEVMQYHIYDVITKTDDTLFLAQQIFIERFKLLKTYLKEWYDKHYKDIYFRRIQPVTTLERKNETESIDIAYQEFLQQGYEGMMVRNPVSYYETNKRSKNLIKRKEFIDEEFEVVDVLEGIGNRSGMMGKMVVKLKNGETCEANARGTHEYFKELLVNKESYIGKLATIRFQNYTPDGSLRFPVMITIRDYE